MKKILLLLLLPFATFAQVPKTLDSLEIYLKTKPKDTSYVKAMNRTAFQYIYKGQFNRADSIANLIGILGEKNNFPCGIYFEYFIKGSIANAKSDNQKALEYCQKAKEIAEKRLDRKDILVSISTKIATIYEQLGETGKAMNYNLQAVAINEKFKVSDISPYNGIANILKKMGQYEKALGYYQKVQKIQKETNDERGLAITENRLGNLYDSWEKPKEAILHYKNGLQLAKKNDYKLLLTDLLVNLGNMSKIFKNYAESENYYKSCEKLCMDLGTDIGLRTVYVNLGDLYMIQKKNILAEKCFQESLNLSKKIKNIEKIELSNENLAEFYGTIQNYPKAYKSLAEAIILKDSIFKMESVEKTQEILTKYETEKKETQIKLLNEEAKANKFQKNAYLIGSLLAVLLVGVVFFFLQNRNKLRQLQESQKLRNKIAADLHDEIGSTLSSISILSEMVSHQQKKGEMKPEIMQQVSNDSREVIDKMDDIIWTINPENDAFYNLETRLKSFAIPMLESKDIDFEFRFSPELEHLKIDMGKRRDVYLIMKEAINNLIKYSNATKAKIEGKIEDKMLIMSVLDNGVGFDTTAETLRNGQKNMKSRAEKIAGNLEIKSEIGKGTEVILEVFV